MSTVQRIAKNSAALIIAQLIMTVLGFFFTMYTARYLGAEGFGILSFALGFTQLFVVIANIGIGPLTVREVARDRQQAPRYLINMAAMKVMLSIVTFALIALVINLLDYPHETVTVVYLVGLSVILMALTAVPQSIFQAFERMEYVALGRILTSGLLLIGLIPALGYGFGVVGFALLYIGAYGIVLIVSLAILARQIAASRDLSLATMRIDLSFWKPTLIKAAPFGISALAMTSLNHIDIVMISAMNSNQDVGLYSVAYRLTFMLLSVRGAIASAAFPVMSRAFVQSRETLTLMAERFFKYYLILALPLGVGTTVLARRTILIIYQQDYLGSVIALQILIWSVVISFVNVTGSVFQATNRQGTTMRIVIVCALVNAALNAVIIPRFSYVGAASTTVASSALMAVLGYAFFTRTGHAFPLSFALKVLARVAPAAAAMGVFAWYLQSAHLAGVILASTLLYFVLLFLLRTFDRADSEIVGSLLRGHTVSLMPEEDQVDEIVAAGPAESDGPAPPAGENR